MGSSVSDLLVKSVHLPRFGSNWPSQSFTSMVWSMVNWLAIEKATFFKTLGKEKVVFKGESRLIRLMRWVKGAGQVNKDPGLFEEREFVINIEGDSIFSFVDMKEQA